MTDRVLITGAGSAAAKAVVEALSSDPVCFYLAARQGDGEVFAGVPNDQRIFLPEPASDAFVPSLLGHCHRHHIDVLIPTTDEDLVALAPFRRLFEDTGIQVLMADTEALALCRDPLALFTALHGIVPVAKTWRLDADPDPHEIPLPALLKPLADGPAENRILASPIELEEAIDGSPALIQEYLPGDESSVDVYLSSDGELEIAVPRVEVAVDNGSTMSHCTVRNARLERLAVQAARRLGLRFAATLRFRRDLYGVPVLLHVIPRFTEAQSLTAISGVNMARLALAEVLGRPRPRLAPRIREIAMVPSRRMKRLPMEGVPTLVSQGALPTLDAGAA